MKSFAIALSVVYVMFIIGSNALSSTNSVVKNDIKESYQACIRLRNKAPFLNLKCENIMQNLPKEVKAAKNDKLSTNVKILSNDVTFTRKVNKSQESKLRRFIKNLSNENKLRKD